MKSTNPIAAALIAAMSILGTLAATTPSHAANATAATMIADTAERGPSAPSAFALDAATLNTGLVLTARCETYVDDDADGLDDGVENCALKDYAPVLQLPLDYDWTRPANVDWYLARTALRFHHNNCNDEQIVPIGGLTQTRLVNQFHRRKRGVASLNPCSHYGDLISSGRGPYDDNHHFFLQPNDSTHAGAANPGDWIVYGHVYPNEIGGMNVQYWFFYAYNDNVGSFNHEGDWESITVRLNPQGNPDGLYVCAHAKCDLHAASNITWHATRHPIIWVADGSHASYTTEVSCDRNVYVEGAGDNCQTVAAYRWFTWNGGRGTQAGLQGGGVINVGEKRHPLNNQKFIRYYAKWGENGTSDVTSGPRTPTFQASWSVGGL